MDRAPESPFSFDEEEEIKRINRVAHEIHRQVNPSPRVGVAITVTVRLDRARSRRLEPVRYLPLRWLVLRDVLLRPRRRLPARGVVLWGVPGAVASGASGDGGVRAGRQRHVRDGGTPVTVLVLLGGPLSLAGVVVGYVLGRSRVPVEAAMIPQVVSTAMPTELSIALPEYTCNETLTGRANL